MFGQVCVEGNIASGKTSFLEHFKKNQNVEVSYCMSLQVKGSDTYCSPKPLTKYTASVGVANLTLIGLPVIKTHALIALNHCKNVRPFPSFGWG